MKQHLLKLRILIITTAFLSLGCFNSKSQRTETADKSILTGEWIISEQTMSPLTIIPHCKSIRKGSIFKFTQDKLEVYADALSKPCVVFLYKKTNNTINIIKGDMVYLCTYELNQTFLKIKSNSFFTPDESASSLSIDTQSTKPPEILVTLIKKPN